ncbi:hypothetical protein [Streptomyces antibioticus]|uniref:hypothetical protein n=1 Tax=Streptomyces antibioticus TaxID=1890 RepID=UPI0036FBE5B4
MIGAALDTALTLGWWLAGWVMVLAAVLTIVLVAGGAVVAWAVRGVWRGVVGPCWAYGRSRARIYVEGRVRAADGRTAARNYEEAA